MRTKLLLVSILMLLITVLTLPLGCGTKPEVAPSESNRWVELLRVLPENENTLKAAYLVDSPYMLEKIPQGEYAVGHNIPMFGSRPGAYTDKEWKETLGFVAGDVDQTIYAGAIPASYYEAVRGRFSPDDVDKAARSGPGNEILEVASYQGHQFYSWGGDRQINLSMRSNVRPLGRGTRLALVGDFVFWVMWTDGIKEMIDSYEGKIKSLADNKDYQLLAGALEKLDTVNAFFSAESHSLGHFNEVYNQKMIEELGPEMRERLIAERDRDIRLKPYRALATGAGKDEKGYYLAIALANADDTTASDNARLLKQRIDQAKIVWPPQAGQKWSDLIESAIIESNGRLTLARLYGPVVELWDSFEIIGGDLYEPLLMHE